MVFRQLLAAADEKPTAADWLAAWAGLVAAVGTIATFVFQARSLRRESEARRRDVARLEAQQRDAEDAQARTVVLHDPGCGGSQWVSIRDYAVTIGNYGAHPITNITATLTYLPTKLTYKVGGPPPLPVLKAGDYQRLSWNTNNVPWPADVNDDLPAAFDCEVHFTDVHGIRWAVRPGLGQQPSRVYGS